LAHEVDDELLVHGTCVAIAGRGVLLRGVPGSGKSDLALRFISSYQHAGAGLVSDDQVQLNCIDGRIVARAPGTIAGMLEVRGVGIIKVSHVADALITLIMEINPGGEIERLPAAPLPFEDVLGVQVPVAALDPDEPSAPVKLKLILTGEI